MRHSRRSPTVGASPLPPRRKWRAITLATLILVPAYWALLFGIVASASESSDAPPGGPFIAFGLALIPFVFIVLAFLSEHPNPPSGILRAMGLALVVGIPVSAVTADVVTGFVAGIGAGGVVALRSELTLRWQMRAIAVVAATAYAFLLVRIVPEVAVLLTPILPFTSIGVADHLSERRAERHAAGRR